MATEQLPEPSNIVLRRFFETSESARKAASHLKAPAEVGVRFTDVAGEYRPGAVNAIASKPDADVGDLGILFFQHIIAQDPQSKIGVKLHSGLLKLTKRGWFGVMMSGGAKVIGWMAAKGLKEPSAIAHALGRLRKG